MIPLEIKKKITIEQILSWKNLLMNKEDIKRGKPWQGKKSNWGTASDWGILAKAATEKPANCAN